MRTTTAPVPRCAFCAAPEAPGRFLYRVGAELLCGGCVTPADIGSRRYGDRDLRMVQAHE
jgi:hypothetical protein